MNSTSCDVFTVLPTDVTNKITLDSKIQNESFYLSIYRGKLEKITCDLYIFKQPILFTLKK